MQGISVVIPNYNGMGLFPDTLPTVFESLESLDRPWELIVVDDASTDNSVAWLAEHYPAIRILHNDTNSGFSVTVNKGVAAARHELVLLLNSDVKLTPGFFPPLLPYFDREDTFGVSARVVGWDDDIVQEAAKYPYFHGVKLKTSGNYLISEEKEMSNGLLTMYLTGAASLIRRDRYLELGGLNELFSPFYVEDYELSLRAWRAGYTCWYEHNAVCRHRTSTTIRGAARKRTIEAIYNRNKMLLHALHLPRLQRYGYFLQLIPETMMHLVLGHAYFIRALSQFLDRYADVRRSRAKFLQNGKSGKLRSVRDVADRILQSIKQKQIIQF
jgi:GT2 family glycosyltransferase